MVRERIQKLSGILIDGANLEGFSSERLEYKYTMVGEQRVPSIAAISNDPAAFVKVERPEELPGTAVIKVTSSDGTVETTYSIDMDFSHYKGIGKYDIYAVECNNPASTSMNNSVDNNFDTYFALEGRGRMYIRCSLI